MKEQFTPARGNWMSKFASSLVNSSAHHHYYIVHFEP